MLFHSFRNSLTFVVFCFFFFFFFFSNNLIQNLPKPISFTKYYVDNLPKISKSQMHSWVTLLAFFSLDLATKNKWKKLLQFEQKTEERLAYLFFSSLPTDTQWRPQKEPLQQQKLPELPTSFFFEKDHFSWHIELR